jgi:hypothetical protein
LQPLWSFAERDGAERADEDIEGQRDRERGDVAGEFPIVRAAGRRWTM